MSATTPAADADGHGSDAGRPYAERSDPRPSDASADAAALRERASTVNRGAARAAVLGVNDGLVTNVCLILAVAGASSDASAVRIAGLASLIAGAFSMAAGEWISVRSQVELYEGVVGELRRLTARNPRLILDELSGSLAEQGLADDTAHRVAAELPLDAEHFIDFSARNLFGVDPSELGSPWVAAGSSLGLFTVGATVPLVSWFVTDGTTAILVSVVATAIASMFVGGWIARSSERPVWGGALRQLGIVVAASAVTYGIGELFGTAVA
jgi:VIT1/CCC1 family predicted Fe2+/Mn2+ transporter